jgi:hypothetical protein
MEVHVGTQVGCVVVEDVAQVGAAAVGVVEGGVEVEVEVVVVDAVVVVVVDAEGVESRFLILYTGLISAVALSCLHVLYPCIFGITDSSVVS